jgi:predicted nucleic acid-binding Zn finger protein
LKKFQTDDRKFRLYIDVDRDRYYIVEFRHDSAWCCCSAESFDELVEKFKKVYSHEE